MRYLSALFLICLSAAQSLSPSSPINKLAVDSSGGIFVAQASSITKLNQWTSTVSFPVLGMTVAASGNLIAAGVGAIASIDPGSGKIISTGSYTVPVSTFPQSIAITSAGNIILSGASSGLPATAGALNIPGEQAFLIKLDPSGKLLWSASGIGGVIAVDSAENIYVAGSAELVLFPTTANAIQKTASFNVCGSTGGIISFIFPCAQQYIAKVSPDGTKMIFSTYLTGALGARAQDIALGSDGSIYTAGTVQATDYPVTSGALIGTMPAKFVNTACNCIVPVIGYASSGFLSRLSPDGSQLFYSTYLGGSQADSVSAMAVAKDGSLTLAGVSMSPDLPGLPAQLDNCRPGISLVNQKQRDFLMQISADGSKIASAQLIGGTNTGTGIACITDAADTTFADTVSPGELITINGIGVGPQAAGIPGFGMPAPQIGGVSVAFDGIPAVLTAAGGTIVSAGVPIAVAGKQQTTLTLLQNGQPVDSRQLNVATLTPSTFLLPANGKSCNAPPRVNFGAETGGSPAPAPLLLNADGSMNACDNPAAAGSTVTFFMNGLGVGTPQLTVAGGELKVIAIGPMEGMTSVSSISVTLPSGIGNPFYFTVMDGLTGGRDAIPVYVK